MSGELIKYAENILTEYKGIDREHNSLKKSSDIRGLIDFKDRCVSLSGSCANMAAEFRFLMEESESLANEVKYDKFLFYRGKHENEKPDNKYTEKEADYLARRLSMVYDLDIRVYRRWYSKCLAMRDKFNELAHSTSQLVSHLKSEFNINQHKTE